MKERPQGCLRCSPDFENRRYAPPSRPRWPFFHPLDQLPASKPRTHRLLPQSQWPPQYSQLGRASHHILSRETHAVPSQHSRQLNYDHWCKLKSSLPSLSDFSEYSMRPCMVDVVITCSPGSQSALDPWGAQQTWLTR